VKPTLIVYGNCQAGAISSFLQTQPTITGQFDVYYWQNFGGDAQLSTPTRQELVRRCQVLWVQFQQRSPEFPAFPAERLLPKAARRQTFPPVDTNLLWPFCAHDALLSRPEPPNYPFGRFPYGDRILMEIADSGSDAINAPQLYRQREQDLLLNPDRIARIEEVRLRRRDAACSVTMSDEIFEALRTERAFWAPNHPAWCLLSKLIEKLILASFPASDRFAHPFHRLTEKTKWQDMLSSYHCPISEAVARGFGLSWWTTDMHYRIDDDVFVCADEYRRLYVSLRQYRLSIN
jgi:Polysaccharide biosynthesis enzyme WcbI